MSQLFSDITNLQEASDILQDKINEITLEKMQWALKLPKSTEEERSRYLQNIRTRKTLLDSYIQEAQQLILQNTSDSNAEIFLEKTQLLAALAKDLGQLTHGAQNISPVTSQPIKAESPSEIEESFFPEIEPIETEEASDKEEDYQGWLNETIDATWQDLDDLTSTEENSASGLEYLRRVSNEVKQELHKAEKMDMLSEVKRLRELLTEVDQRLDKTKRSLRSKAKPIRKAREFVLPPKKKVAPKKQEETKKVKKTGLFHSLKEWFVTDDEEDTPKAQAAASSNILAMMQKNKKPSKLKMFANVLGSTSAGTTAYDSKLFGEETTYKTNKDKD